MPDLQNTNYNGAVVSSELAAALQRKPIGQELLRFFPRGDQTVMQVRLPEKGRYVPNLDDPGNPALEGVEFDIRVNMNYLVRGVVRACMDRDGNVDPNKLETFMDLSAKLSRGLRGNKTKEFRQFVDLLDIPADKRPGFEAFLRANHVGATGQVSQLLDINNGPISKLAEELEGRMLSYQAAADGELGAAAKNHVAQYKKPFSLTMQSYRDMANMDPETETRILYPMDCLSFRNLTEHFIRQNNAYRKAHGQEEYAVEPMEIDFKDQKQAAKQQGKQLLFTTHAYLAADVELELPGENGEPQKKNYTLSLETTAPAYGSLFHRQSVVPTGVGVFENKAAIEAYHRSRNVAEVPELEQYLAVKDHVSAARGEDFPILRDSEERTYRRYIDRHTGGAVGELSGKKLEEYAAKVTAAAYLNKTQGDNFDLKRLHKYAEALRESPGFQAAIKTAGEEKLRAALTTGRASEVVALTVGRNRYALSDDAKDRLAAMAASMETEGRSPEWKALKSALTDRTAKDSMGVFQAVEKYLKGKKKVRRGRAGREAADLAISALAVAAGEGDAVAKQRAQTLVDRINEVRGVEPGDRYYVDLRDYPKANGPEAPVEQAELPAERQSGNEGRPGPERREAPAPGEQPRDSRPSGLNAGEEKNAVQEAGPQNVR